VPQSTRATRERARCSRDAEERLRLCLACKLQHQLPEAHGHVHTDTHRHPQTPAAASQLLEGDARRSTCPRLHYRLLALCPAPTAPVGQSWPCVCIYVCMCARARARAHTHIHTWMHTHARCVCRIEHHSADERPRPRKQALHRQAARGHRPCPCWQDGACERG
jgi:hypothetical protein